MSLPPFSPTGAAVSLSTATVGPGTLTFDLSTTTVTIPLNCVVQVAAGSDEQWIVGTVLVSTGSQIKVSVGDLSGTDYQGSGTFSDWRIKVVAPPPNPVSFYSINGLRVSQSSPNSKSISIQAGSVRDSTDTVNLVLDTVLTKRLDQTFVAGSSSGAYVTSAVLAGTITQTSPSATVTGTSTTFTSSFESTADGGYLNDLADQVGQISVSGATRGSTAAMARLHSVISKDGSANSAKGISSVASNTSLTLLSGSLSLGTGVQYRRGGFPDANGGWLCVLLIRRDSDGHIDICTSATNSSAGEPDLPSGYTKYRVIAVIFPSGVNTTIDIYQPLVELNAPSAAMIRFDDSHVSFDADSVQKAIEQIIQRGTYTPTVSLIGGAGNTTPVYTTNTGYYTRIKDTVFVDIVLDGDGGAEGAGTGTVFVSLPFTSAGTGNGTSTDHHVPCGSAVNGTAEYALYTDIRNTQTATALSYFDTASNRSAFTGALQNDTNRCIRLKFWFEAVTPV